MILHVLYPILHAQITLACVVPGLCHFMAILPQAYNVYPHYAPCRLSPPNYAFAHYSPYSLCSMHIMPHAHYSHAH